MSGSSGLSIPPMAAIGAAVSGASPSVLSSACCVAFPIIAGTIALLVTYLVFQIQAVAGTNVAMVAKHFPKMAIALSAMTLPTALVGAALSPKFSEAAETMPHGAKRAGAKAASRILPLFLLGVLATLTVAALVLNNRANLTMQHLGITALGSGFGIGAIAGGIGTYYLKKEQRAMAGGGGYGAGPRTI